MVYIFMINFYFINKMDYQSEMNNVLTGHVPEWFYQLPYETINSIVNDALSNYTTVTSQKNDTFLIYWQSLLDHQSNQ